MLSPSLRQNDEGVVTVNASNLEQVQVLDPAVQNDQGVVTAKSPSELTQFAKSFIDAIAQHRFWMREEKEKVPA